MENNPYLAENIIKAFNLDDNNDTRLKITYLVKKIMKAAPDLQPAPLYSAIETVLLLDKTLSSLDDFYFYKFGSDVKIETRYTFWPKKLIEYGVATQVDAFIVRENDVFEVEVDGDKMTVHHKTNPFKTDSEIIGAYARAVLSNGAVIFAFANKDELNSAKNASKSKGGVWKVWELEMSKKVPLKRLMKLVPIPQDITKAIEADNMNYKDIKELNEEEKTSSSKEAINNLNSKAQKTKGTEIVEFLANNGVKFELRNGYVKTNKNNLSDEFVEKIKIVKELEDGSIVFKNTKIDFSGSVVKKENKEEEPIEDNNTKQEATEKIENKGGSNE